MARDFQGSGHVVYSDAALYDNVHTFTWCAWAFKDTATSGGQVFAKRSTVSGQGKTFQADSNIVANALRLFVNRATTNAAANSTTTTWPIGEWRFVACTYDGTDGPRLFMGTPATAVAEMSYQGTREVGSGAEADESQQALCIGARDSGGGAGLFDGRIAEGRVFNVRLTVDELNRLKLGSQARLDAMLGYWPLFGGQSPEPDWSGRGNHATVANTVIGDHPPGIAIWPRMVSMVLAVPAAGAQTTKTQTGVSRITAQPSKTQTGVSRITAQTTKTQTGVARITAQTTKTQTGVSRITAQTSRTQAGVSRVTAQTTKTQAGVARVTAQTTKTQTGVSRVTAQTTKTQTGVSNLLVTGQASQTQTGVSRITAQVTKTQTGLTRITAQTTKTQAGVSNIASGAATTTKNQTGLSRITARTSRSTSGTAAIHKTTERTIAGVSSIGVPAPFTSIQTIPGIARIFSQSAIKRRITISIPVSGSN